MPGLDEFPFSQFLYGTDCAGERYSEDERRWVELLSEMGRSAEEMEPYLKEPMSPGWKSVYGLLKIGQL